MIILTAKQDFGDTRFAGHAPHDLLTLAAYCFLQQIVVARLTEIL